MPDDVRARRIDLILFTRPDRRFRSVADYYIGDFAGEVPPLAGRLPLNPPAGDGVVHVLVDFGGGGEQSG